ncbi:hypothetical protein ONE63_008295 [Megalurothrips usitatus]|uniref:Uncharacterized protein n=1 Tax=Megalurothrips usitatus TaxID=439358 RepID=A0AAV7XPW2_9NEOP|nr:hypothetical protein ONE63_008295 [Megalurothrips usitatus]
MAAGPLGRKTSSAGEAYHRIVGVPSSTRNPLYGLGLQGLQAMNAPGLADSVAGSASDDTSSASASRHYVDPWDLENFMYLKRHWAEEEQASSTPALETAAQSDFYYVGLDGDVDVDIVDVDVEAYPAPYRPDSVLLLADEPLSLGAVGLNMNSVEEESFFNERYDPARHHRLVKRSHSAAATYLQHRREEPRAVSVMASMASANARNAYAARRRSVACAPRYYRTPITGGGESQTVTDRHRPSGDFGKIDMGD